MRTNTQRFISSLVFTLTVGYTGTQLALPAEAAPAPAAVDSTSNFNPSSTLDRSQVIAADAATCATVGGAWVDADKPYPWCNMD